MAGAGAEPLSLRHDPRPFVLVDHPHAEFLSLLELRPRAGPGDDKVGLGADRADRACAEPLGLRLGFVTAHGFEAAGEDDRLAAPLGLFHVADKGPWSYFGKQVVERLLIVRLV